MLNYISHLFERAQQLTRQLHHLLGPPGSSCLTCGTRALLSSHYPGICTRCVQQIPWIRAIRCQRCGRGVGCPDCVRPHMQRRSFICNRSAVQYNELMREWISMYKFRGHERYAPLLTALLIQAFQAMSEELTRICGKETLKPLWRPDALTYVPVSEERLAERGFNQAERLAAGLATAARIPGVDLLQRQINTGKQSFKSRAERFETMKHAFSIKLEGIDIIKDIWKNKVYESSINPKNQQEKIPKSDDKNGIASFHDLYSQAMNDYKPLKVLLIDDIYTTGSTLDACGQVILQASNHAKVPVEIYTLTLARS
ncbi:ComF family protein [Paenibacillus barcinonensis]|uniref:ComF family protein n=1 Tax=Paenibacillus barcinonensis TaxID=198119 RepID=UPI001C121928|nr:ComF family protein [Paenibacillus barcinonensis]MBU5355374.1 ComF family protein [Paenibacillus barcinonensis]